MRARKYGYRKTKQLRESGSETGFYVRKVAIVLGLAERERIAAECLGGSGQGRRLDAQCKAAWPRR